MPVVRKLGLELGAHDWVAGNTSRWSTGVGAEGFERLQRVDAAADWRRRVVRSDWGSGTPVGSRNSVGGSSYARGSSLAIAGKPFGSSKWDFETPQGQRDSFHGFVHQGVADCGRRSDLGSHILELAVDSSNGCWDKTVDNRNPVGSEDASVSGNIRYSSAERVSGIDDRVNGKALTTAGSPLCCLHDRASVDSFWQIGHSEVWIGLTWNSFWVQCSVDLDRSDYCR